MDNVQLLVDTHAPDFFRFPEYVSFAVLILLIGGMASKVIDLNDRPTMFVLALTLVAFVIFNQQLITGRSLQPIHYQVFIGNYCCGVGGMSPRSESFRNRNSLREIRFPDRLFGLDDRRDILGLCRMSLHRSRTRRREYRTR
jgi:hypothetical protein